MVLAVLAVERPAAFGGIHARRACNRRELFSGKQISVSTIECGPDGGGLLHTQDARQPAIVLVRAGRYGRLVNGRSSVVDSTQGYVQQAGDQELVQHLGDVGHRCTVLTLRSDDLPTLFRVRARLAPIEFRTSPATDLAHRLLLAECRRGGETAVIAEMGAALVADLLAAWSHPPRPVLRRGTSAATRRIVDIARELATPSSTAASLQSIASAANVSPPYLTRVFRQGTGLTLSRYRNRVRVRLALERLAEGEDDLKRVAHELGFFDHPHFSRIVMAEVGLQPRTLRALLSAQRSPALNEAWIQRSASITRSA